MGISNLPGPGSKFRSSIGSGSFSRKLYSATRYGGLSNLKDNMPSIKRALKPYEKYIKLGGLSRMQRVSVLRKIRALDKNISKEDIRDIKKVLEHLSK